MGDDDQMSYMHPIHIYLKYNSNFSTFPQHELLLQFMYDGSCKLNVNVIIVTWRYSYYMISVWLVYKWWNNNNFAS